MFGGNRTMWLQKKWALGKVLSGGICLCSICSFHEPFIIKCMHWQWQKYYLFSSSASAETVATISIDKTTNVTMFWCSTGDGDPRTEPRAENMTNGRFDEKDANFLPKFTPVSQVGGEKFIENVLRWEPGAQLYSHYQTVWENILSIIWTFNIALFLSNPLLNSKPIIVIFWKTPYPFQNKIFG